MDTEQIKPTSNKKIFIIIFAVILLVIITLVTVFALSSDDNKNNQNIQQTQTPESTQSETRTQPAIESEFTGQTDKCQPLNEHQWFRSDSTLTIDPTNSDILNIFIEKRGFFRSEDGGESWEYKSKGIKGFKAPDTPQGRPCFLEFRASVVDQTNPDRILLGALGDFDTIDSMFNKAGGLLESLDGGESWNQILTNEVNAYVHDIAIDPQNPDTIYYITSSQKPANREASINTKGLVYKTTNGGKSWKELNTGLLPDTGAQNIHMNPKDSSQLIVTSSTFSRNAMGGRAAGSETLGILITNDGGETWKGIKSLPPGDSTVLESFISPTNFNNLYVPVMSDTGARSYFSIDGGMTFEKSAFPMDIVAYDPADATGKAMVGYSWQSGSKSMFKSIDSGKTWQQYGTLPKDITNIQDPKLRIQKIIISEGDSNLIYMAGASAFVWRSTDGGLTWQTMLSLDTLP
jgi:photosystem II stability/assembly factor-like uncharacterized protein